jgi:hypothetical protein
LLLAVKISDFNERVEMMPTWPVLADCEKKYSDKEIFSALTDRITEKVSGLQVKLTRFKNSKKRPWKNYLLN